MKMNSKIIKFNYSLLFGLWLTLIGLTSPVIAVNKKDPCLKNNNGIGNNHDIDLELPTNSQTLNDINNHLLTIRIDPGNPGQMKQCSNDLAEDGFTATEIDFVITQIWDAEMKLKQNKFQCPAEYYPNPDYSGIFAD